MTSTMTFFRIWAHRSSGSIFGAASSPVIRNGAFLCFETEQRAQDECDRLNARRGDLQRALHRHAHPHRGDAAERADQEERRRRAGFFGVGHRALHRLGPQDAACVASPSCAHGDDPAVFHERRLNGSFSAGALRGRHHG